MEDYQNTAVLHNGAVVVNVDTASWGEQAFAQDYYHFALVRRDLKTVENRPGKGHVRLAMEPERIVFVRPGEIEHVITDDKPGQAKNRVSLAAFLFKADLIKDTFGDLKLDGLRDIADPIANHLLKAAVQLGDEADPLLVDHLSMAIACRIRGLKQPENLKSKGRIERAVVYINDRLEQPLTLAELASVAAMSSYHFARTFRDVTGVTPLAYVMTKRVDRAKGLMTQPHLQMVSIASLCGFSSQSHFSVAFKQRTGVTPAAYRKLLSGK